MDARVVDQLEKVWGGVPCEHKVLARLTSQGRQVESRYVCIACGTVFTTSAWEYIRDDTGDFQKDVSDVPLP